MEGYRSGRWVDRLLIIGVSVLITTGLTLSPTGDTLMSSQSDFGVRVLSFEDLGVIGAICSSAQSMTGIGIPVKRGNLPSQEGNLPSQEGDPPSQEEGHVHPTFRR